jgi:hypothetical protein
MCTAVNPDMRHDFLRYVFRERSRGGNVQFRRTKNNRTVGVIIITCCMCFDCGKKTYFYLFLTYLHISLGHCFVFWNFGQSRHLDNCVIFTNVFLTVALCYTCTVLHNLVHMYVLYICTYCCHIV